MSKSPGLVTIGHQAENRQHLLIEVIYIVSAWTVCALGHGANLLIIWCRHQESISEPTDYKSFSQPSNDAICSEVLLEFVRDLIS